jgi:hypothetical protein
MTGYTVHTGSTAKYSTGWDNIFSGSGGRKSPSAKKKAAKPQAAKTAKKKSRRSN